MNGSNHGQKEITLLTLGDGDFTYSLDLARHLATGQDKWNSVKGNNAIRLVATGVDTKEELMAKYKDTPFVLEQLIAIQNDEFLTVTVRHNVNAIPDNNPKDTISADHVMFHHPHLGTEDAAWHGRFLCHLFHSCTHYWMKEKGALLHLTLVEGQYQRWKCAQAAERNGLVLLSRCPFVPPPVETPTYHYRRHQSGKSFESRRPSGSETFTFAKQQDQGTQHQIISLPWQTETANNAAPSAPNVGGPTLECPYCDKTFREERSRKCHVRDKHPEGSEKKPKTVTQYKCQVCTPERLFDSEQALQAHKTAKHSAIHKTIQPDWRQKEGQEVAIDMPTAQGAPGSSSCPICGVNFRDEDHHDNHLREFRPSEVGTNFRCTFCAKAFRERRAKLQHENFCSKRTDSKSI